MNTTNESVRFSKCNIDIMQILEQLSNLSSSLSLGSSSKYIENVSYLISINTITPDIEKYLNSQIISLILKELIIESGSMSSTIQDHKKAVQNFQLMINKAIKSSTRSKIFQKKIESALKLVIEANHKLVYENVQILSEEIKTKLRILNKINELSKETPFDWNLTAFQNLVDRSTEFQSFPVYTKQAQPYLPVIRSNQKTLVLDLDETLVHKSGNLVLIRPGAEQFLKEVSQEYEVVIFTAAMQSYADFAMRKLDPDNLVKLRLYRQNVSFDQQGPFKDLEMIGRELKNVVIVDNLETNFRYQRENGICIKTWTGDLNDQELYKLASIVKDFFQNKEST